jgi:hypothetical protein
MKKELLCSFLFGLWNHFVLFWFEPRFYIVEFDYFTNNFELYIFFYVFYKFVIEIFLYFIGYIFKMFKFRNIHFENQIEQYAKLIHGLMLAYTLMSLNEDELIVLKFSGFFVFRFIFLNWKSRFRIDFQFKVFYRRFLILLILILIFKIIKNFFDK